MKLKPALNSAALKQFFADHGEKFGFVVALLLTGYAILCALEIEPYAKTAKELQADVEKARQNLNTSEKRLNLDEAKIKLPPIDYVTLIDQELIQKLNPARFNGIEWNRPLFETKQRRNEPTYLAVRDLRVEFHYAAVSEKVGGTDARPVGEEWIAVTGLIPLEDQTAAYYRAFQSALDQVTNAVPAYHNFEIRRAEVTDPNAKIDWNAIEPLKQDVAVAAEMAKWAGPGPEIPAAQFTLPVLTQPLPPLVGAEKTQYRDYTGWSTHPGLEASNVPAVAEGGGPGAGGVLGAPIAAPPQPQLAQSPNQNKEDKGPRPKNLLFRFLDFDVHQGKQYCYQVRLILKNPNYKLDPAHLEKPELGEGDIRTAPWSAPSPVVGIPYLDWFFAAGMKGSGVGGDNEPEISMGYKQWYPELGAVVRAKFTEILRGASLTGAGVQAEYPPPGGEGTATATATFPSGPMLIDFSWERTEARLGGPPNDRKVNRPAEALVLNSRGELIICAQTMDQVQWDDITAVGVGGVGPRGGSGIGAGGSPLGGAAAPAATNPIAAPTAPALQPTATQPPTTQPAAATPTATPSGSGPKLQLKLN